MTARFNFRDHPGTRVVVGFTFLTAVAAHSGQSPWLRSLTAAGGMLLFLGPLYLRGAWLLARDQESNDPTLPGD